ncbi:choice-of-anchor D domain-containing protein [bacterium]|nr:choice-of-anchor D domain-containing protein [bacterium]
MTRRHFVAPLLLLLALPQLLTAQSTCDSDTRCLGNALRFSGGNLDYVDVFTTPALRSVDSTRAMTVELWMRVSRQSGVRQYIGGEWGPRTDTDDRWLLFIDESDSLVFTLSPDVSRFGDFDNTTIKTAMRYDVWMHVAAMWDGGTQQARLFIDGTLQAQGRNADTPLTAMRATMSYLQWGSFNGQTNDPSLQRPLTGELDEIRMWNRTLGEAELRCLRYASLQGDEAGLILYFRCNEAGGDVLCDASDFNGRGNRRGTLRFVPSTRIVPQSVFITPAAFSLPLGCTADTTLTVTVTDTSSCAQQVALSLSGPDAGQFILGSNFLTLSQNQPSTVQLQTQLRVTGNIRATLNVTPLNSCNPASVIPIDIQRRTQLTPTPGRVVFDTLFGCVNQSTSDTTLQICNTSGGPITVTSLLTSSPAFTAVPGGGWTLPVTLQPGDCRDVLLSFAPADTGSFVDTLLIASDDVCPGSGRVPLFGRNVDIARLTLSSISFDRPNQPCRRSLNLAEQFYLTNRTNEPFVVEAIEFSNPVFSTPTTLPFTARVGRSHRMYIRFQSSVEGYYTDTARIRMNFRGCIVYRDIPLDGRIVDVQLSARDSLVQFGNVIVGQSATLPVTIDNNGIDTRDVFMYLSSGRVFSIMGGNRVNIAPGSAATVNVNFRPLNPVFYRDTLNFQDVGCQIIKRVILEGNGVFGSLVFDPGYLQAGNVINCQCRQDTVTVTNNTGAALTLRSVSITGSVKFTFLPPLPATNEILPVGGQRQYIIQYCPAGAPDFVTETADLVFDTDGPEGELRMLLTGTNIEPKLTIDAMTNFGDVEVGTTLTRVLRITNPSPTPVVVDAIPPLPAGFTVLSAVPPIGSTLQYRDTMLVTVEFAPSNNTTYGGGIAVQSGNPCTVEANGQLQGRGIIIPLFVPWSTIVFTEATRCDSVLRVIGLVNDGSVPITIDSIWITGTDAAAFSWKGRTFSGLPPRDTPPHFADSIDIRFFPARVASVQSVAQLHVAATTRLGQQVYSINLVGSRVLQYIPSIASVVFPATPVLTAAMPVSVTFQNPSYLDALIIDNVSFVPDQGVFAYAGALPLSVPPRASRSLDFLFRPRAAVAYDARIRLVTRVSCEEVDTTLSITGSGYTPPWLITLCMDTTITADIGEVLRLPVFLNRDIPQNPLDLDFSILFHRRALEYLGFEPVFTARPVRDTLRPDGVRIALRDNQQVTSGPVGWISFRVAASDRMQFVMRTDSITFASDSTLFIALFGDGCMTPITINPRCGIDSISISENRDALEQNYPNPASALTTIEFETVEDTPVRIALRDARGREVAILTDTWYTHGRYQLTYDVSGLSSGIYSYEMRTRTYRQTRVMVVVE